MHFHQVYTSKSNRTCSNVLASAYQEREQERGNCESEREWAQNGQHDRGHHGEDKEVVGGERLHIGLTDEDHWRLFRERVDWKNIYWLQ